MTWWKDRLGDEERNLYQQCFDFDTQLSTWLRQADRAEVISMSDYEDFQRFLPAEQGTTLLGSVPRALIYCFTRGCRDSGKQIHPELHAEEEELWNRLDGPVFHCCMLAGTSCEDPCDWLQIAEEPYAIDRMDRLALGEIFIRDVSFNTTGTDVIIAKHIEHGSYLDPAFKQGDGRCSVLGCDEEFPATLRNGYHFSV